MKKNDGLNSAKAARNDEYYTLYSDIEKELKHYQNCFKDKVVYCNCDDYQRSNFVKYFRNNFAALQLKKLISTNYVNQQFDMFSAAPPPAKYFEFDGRNIRVRNLKNDGDFRSGECIQILNSADIIVTNPPFSLFIEYFNQLIKYQRKFLIMGSLNAVKYKPVFPLIKAGKIWLGTKSSAGDTMFDIPENQVDNYLSYKKENSTYKMIDGQIKGRVGGVIWFTNLGVKKYPPPLELTAEYTPAAHPKYDGYNAVNADRVADIPKEYSEQIGVPISFLDKYNPNQFELVYYHENPVINGKHKYARFIIKRRTKI